MTSAARILIAGQPCDPSLPLPAGAWVTVGDDGVRSLLPGVVSVGGQLVIVLPRCYAHADLAPGAALATVALFVSTLARYAHERTGQRAITDPLLQARDDALLAVGEPGDLVDGVEAALLLWRDYLANGRVVLGAARDHDQLPGRPLWERAMRQGDPVEGRAGVVFRELPRRSVRPDLRHELTELHETTCEEIGARFGLGPAPIGRAVGAREALERLERAERVCFADRPRRVVGLLRRYLASRTADGAGASDVRGLFARKYAYVWERMLQVALSHEGRGAGLRGRYLLADGGQAGGLDLRPDVVLRTRLPDGRAALLVLDAKDYDVDSLPGSADLGKQVLYRLLLSRLLDPAGLPLEAIGNAFLFPGVVPGDGVRLRGVHDLTGAPLPGHPARVVALDVDLEQVSEAYVAGRSIEHLRRAILTATFEGGGAAAEQPFGVGAWGR